MKNATYRVATIPKAPFVMYDSESKSYSGMLIELLDEIARRLGFEYEIHAQKEQRYGYMDEEGNWDGMIRDLAENKADIGLATFSLMAERMNAVDFTEPFFEHTGFSALMLKPKGKSAFFRFLTVLELEVWLCIIGAFFFTSLSLWIFDMWSPYSYQNNPDKYKDDEGKRIFTLRESLWFCMTSLTPQGGGEAPKNLSGRLAAATWWLFGFIIVASYTANLAAYLTLAKFEKRIETLNDLVTQYRYSYTVIENSSAHVYFKRMNDIQYTFYGIWKDMSLNDSMSPYDRSQLAVWEYPLSDKYIRILSTINFHKTVGNLSQALDKFSAPDSRFVLITEATDVQYQVMIDCKFKEIGPEFSKKPYAIALQKNSPLTDQFNNIIQELNREKWLADLRSKWWYNNPNRKRCYDDNDDHNGINPRNVGGVFLLMLIGISAAFLTLIYEYFYCKYFGEQLERAYDRKLETFKSRVSEKFRRFDH